METIAVIGAGISGLACAYELQKAGQTVQVYERQTQVGGRMSTRRSQGLAFDLGANFLVLAYPRLVALAESGVRRVMVAAPGFLTPGLETLEELGVRGREAFQAAGGEDFALVDAPAGRPELLRALASALESSATPF